MQWIAPSEKDSATITLEKRLWDDADQFRANSDLKPQEYSGPILGLIFLRFAEVRFAALRAKLEAAGSSARRGSRVDDPTAYQAESVLYLAPEARFDYLLTLPESADISAGDDVPAQVLQEREPCRVHSLHDRCGSAAGRRRRAAHGAQGSQGAGEFPQFVHVRAERQKRGIQLIPVSEVAAKDEFLNIKNVTRYDQLAAHRVPPQLMGIIAHNTGGFGDVEKAARVFAVNEIVPLQGRLKEINDWFGVEVMKLKPYELAVPPAAAASRASATGQGASIPDPPPNPCSLHYWQ